MPKKSSKAEDILFAVLEMPTEERAEFLEQACDDDEELRVRIEKMLKVAPKVTNFLEQPISDQDGSANLEASREGPGTRIGHYKLLQEIGEGGFGIVYMAEQLEPVRRQVALKIIKPGMDSREIIARFEAERQALALMDHTNIARVLDAGSTESGRPYFVMELVKGVSITEFCDKNNLDTKKRLDLFMTVCRAVQHAHQKGVIHRDIKPSNIMITLHDGDAVPKVIDFGVSKAISQRLTEKTMFTRYGQMVGTPQYMSPEQAEMSGLDVDTRSDVYSLGVLLYELLTGTTPLEGEKLRTAGYAEMVRMIQTEDPEKPSTRISSRGACQSVVGGHRGTDAKRLRQLVKGDLDWIVMKALEKHRDRRYETATEFARDIERHLKDEPVLAGPPSATYLLSKIVRRNKAAVVTASVVLAALIVGLVAAVWGFANARHHRAIAEKRLDRAEVAEKEAIVQRDKAREAKTTAENAVREKATYADRLEHSLYDMHLLEADKAVRNNKYQMGRRELEACPPKMRGWEWSFLKKRLGTVPVSFEGTGNPIYTPDGRCLLSIGERGSTDEFNVLVWDSTTGEIVEKYESETKLCLLAMSPDGTILAAGSPDGTLTVWNAANPQDRWQIKNETRVLSLAVGPNGSIAVADASGAFTVYDAGSENVKFEFPRSATPPESPNDATQSTLGNVASSDSIQRPKWNRVHFSPNGKWIALGSHTFDGVTGKLPVDRHGSQIVIIDASTGKVVAEFEDGYFLPTFSPDSKTIATAIKDEIYKIVLWNWDGKTKSLSQSKSWPVSDDSENTIMDFSFRAGSTHLAALQRRTPQVWDFQTGKKIAELGAWRADWITMHPTKKDQAAFFHRDRMVQEWKYAERPSEEATKVTLPAPGRPMFSPNGKWIAINDGTLQGKIESKLITIVHAESGVVYKSFPGKTSRAPWLPDSSRLVVVRGPAHRVEIIDALTGVTNCLLEEKGGNAPRTEDIWSFAIDNETVVTVTRNTSGQIRDGWIRTYNAITGGCLKEFQYTGSMGWTRTCVDVSQKTNRVAIGTEDRAVEIWDTESESLWRTVRAPGVIHYSIDLSADGDQLYIGNLGNTLTVHYFDTEHEIEFRDGGNGGRFAFSPNGKQVVTGFTNGNNKKFVLYDVETRRQLITLHESEGNDLGPVEWSPDGKRIAAVITTNGNHELYIWDLPPSPNIDAYNADNNTPNAS